MPPSLNRLIQSLRSSTIRSSLVLATMSLGLVVIVTGCASQAGTQEDRLYPRQYQQAAGIESASVSSLNEKQRALREKFADFEKLFADFKQPDLRPLVETVYAEELYFNDTLHSFNSREPMLAYMQETADRVDYTRVKIIDIIPRGEDYFLRWSMDTGFTVFGREIQTHSIGMTHVRFNDQGLVNFHQDFWDNTEGLFRHLPVVGYLIEKTKNRL